MLRRLAVLFVVLFSASVAAADIAPDPGYVRQAANLVLESDADLSGYRFFLESPMKVEEIKIASGAPTVIEASGRAGAMRFGKLIAVPSTDIPDLSGPLLEQHIREKKFPNARQLLSHNFQATIPESERSNWRDPVYRISVADGVISVSPISAVNSGSGKLTYSVWQLVWPVAVGAFLLAGVIALLVIRVVRRSGKKV